MTTEAAQRPPEPLRVTVKYDAGENRYVVMCSDHGAVTSRISKSNADLERDSHRKVHRINARRAARRLA